MKKVGTKNTDIEAILSRELWHRGLRFTKNYADLPGKPDFVFKGKKLVVFCDGDYWHGRNWNQSRSGVKSNSEFWDNKIQANHERDLRQTAELEAMGWRVLRFWGSDIKKDPSACADIVENALSSPTYSVVDLFAGIGGIRLGFERAFSDTFKLPKTNGVMHVTHVSTVLTCDINEKSLKTYFHNFPKCDVINDVCELKGNALRKYKFDICLAGFPCQAFSMAGHREGLDDKKGRGRLFYEVTRICEKKRPMVIFCENVKGLQTMGKGKVLEGMLEELKRMDYEPYFDVLNSIDFGVPQNRERIYIVAFDKRRIPDPDFHFPHGSNPPGNTLDLIWDENPDPDSYMTVQYLDTLERHRELHESKNHGFGYVVKSRSDTANAVMCGGMGRERNLLYDPRDDIPKVNSKGKPLNDRCIRVMTPLEWERLQGFPDGYTASAPKTRRYEQLGNSVTVPVIEAIARNIREVLDRYADDN